MSAVGFLLQYCYKLFYSIVISFMEKQFFYSIVLSFMEKQVRVRDFWHNRFNAACSTTLEVFAKPYF